MKNNGVVAGSWSLCSWKDKQEWICLNLSGRIRGKFVCICRNNRERNVNQLGWRRASLAADKVTVLLLGTRGPYLHTGCSRMGAWNAYGNVSKGELLKAQIKNLILKIKRVFPWSTMIWEKELNLWLQRSIKIMYFWFGTFQKFQRLNFHPHYSCHRHHRHSFL